MGSLNQSESIGLFCRQRMRYVTARNSSNSVVRCEHFELDRPEVFVIERVGSIPGLLRDGDICTLKSSNGRLLKVNNAGWVGLSESPVVSPNAQFRIVRQSTGNSGLVRSGDSLVLRANLPGQPMLSAGGDGSGRLKVRSGAAGELERFVIAAAPELGVAQSQALNENVLFVPERGDDGFVSVHQISYELRGHPAAPLGTLLEVQRKSFSTVGHHRYPLPSVQVLDPRSSAPEGSTMGNFRIRFSGGPLLGPEAKLVLSAKQPAWWTHGPFKQWPFRVLPGPSRDHSLALLNAQPAPLPGVPGFRRFSHIASTDGQQRPHLDCRIRLDLMGRFSDLQTGTLFVRTSSPLATPLDGPVVGNPDNFGRFDANHTERSVRISIGALPAGSEFAVIATVRASDGRSSSEVIPVLIRPG